MRYTKIFNDQLDHGYAVMRMNELGRDFVLIASEEDQPCYAYDLDDDHRRITVWDGPGGTMTMVQLPGTLDFLATQRFYPGFNSRTCRIVRGTFNGDGWDITEVASTPYIHRFDLIPHEGGFWYVGCSIANSKRFTDDWSDPGKVFVGEYDAEANELRDVRELPVRITKNHGYRRGAGDWSFITGHEGIFRLDYPAEGRDWTLTKVAGEETSDLAAIDVDGDGRVEYLAIQGFHGERLRMYDEDWHSIDVTEPCTPFGHAIEAVTLHGVPMFLFGHRAGAQELMEVSLEDGRIAKHVIEAGVGPSNVLVYAKDGAQYLLSANREANSLAIYRVDADDAAADGTGAGAVNAGER